MSDATNKVGPTGMIVMGIIFVAVGIGVIFLGMNEVQTSRKKAAARDWPKINGVVVRSDVRQLRDTSIPNTRNWVPDLSYSYEVDGQQYMGENYSFMSWSRQGASKVAAQKLADKYKEGGNIVVRVDPADPTNSVIRADIQIPFMSYMLPVFGGLGVLAGLGLAGSGVKGKLAGG